MASIAIITDTDSSLPADVAAHYNIRQVPINIHFGQETCRTGVDIDDAQLFARIDRTGEIPTPSAPSPGQFAEAYQAAFAEGAQEVVCFCVSSKASATYSAAVNARNLFEEQLRASVSCPDTIMMAELTPGLSIYGGAGLVGVALVAGK
jgi:DegV family protein with EDD domain